VITLKSLRRYFSHCTSQVRATSGRYSVSNDERDIVDYFFDFHEMRYDLMKTQNTVIDLLVLGHVTWYESANPSS